MLPPHRLARSRNVRQQRQSRTQAGATSSTLLRQSGRDLRQPGRFRHFERCLAVVNPRAQLGIGSAVEKKLDGEQIPLGDSHVERRVVVDSALVRIDAEGQQQPKDFVDVRSSLGARHVSRADQRRDQRRKPVVNRRVWVGADFQQASG